MARSKWTLLVFIGIGMSLGVVVLMLTVWLPVESRLRQFLILLSWPVDHAITWYAHVFLNGNTDQFIPQGVLLWVAYWLVIGASLGLAAYGVERYLVRGWHR